MSDTRETPVPGYAYIALLGRSVWALINAYYAVVREKQLHPGRVIILAEEPYVASAQTAREGLAIISEAFGFSPVIDIVAVGEADVAGAGTAIEGLVREMKRQGSAVSVDITSGRKATVAGALITIARADLEVRNLFYLAIRATEDIARPYMMIPLHAQQIRDFIDDAAVRS